MPLSVSLALLAVCERHGIELSGLSDAQLVDRIPDVMAALKADQRQDAERHRRVIEKTALAVNVIRANQIPNAGIVRDEYLPVRSARPALRTNDCFDDFGLFSALTEGDR